MAENFIPILKQCELDDFKYLSKVLYSFIPLSKPGKLQVLLFEYEESLVHRQQLINELDQQIRYFGSSNLAYVKRSILDNESGLCASEIVNDVFIKLKVGIKKGPSSIETRLKRLVNKVVEKELIKMNSKQLSKAFETIGMGKADTQMIMQTIRLNGKVAILPALINILGPEVTLSVIETIIVGLISQITGAQAAKLLMKEMLKRNPWINALGPIVWVTSSSWFAYDMQGPAFRKTIPVCLYLGVVLMREPSAISEEPSATGKEPSAETGL